MKRAEILSPGRIRSLVNEPQPPCATITMPTVRAGRDVRQNPIRLKNLVDQAEQMIEQDGRHKREAAEILKPARDLIEQADFWQHMADGLVVFASNGRFECYRLPLDLPESAVVAPRFHLKQMFPLLVGDGRFFVLAISKKQARLLECSRHAHHRVHVPEMPHGLDDLMQHIEEEKSLQFHSGTQAESRGGEGGRRAAVFHGHGTTESDIKPRIMEYFRQVDAAIRPVLRGQRALLVFAGVEYLLPLFRAACTYPNLLEQSIQSNPDRIDDEQLHEQAWRIVAPRFDEVRHRVAEAFQAAAGTGLASSHIEEVLPAVIDGRVANLFVVRDAVQWGRFDPEARTVEVHETEQPGDEDLFDAAATHTFLHDGRVFAVDEAEMPGPGPVAAVYRY